MSDITGVADDDDSKPYIVTLAEDIEDTQESASSNSAGNLGNQSELSDPKENQYEKGVFQGYESSYYGDHHSGQSREGSSYGYQSPFGSMGGSGRGRHGNSRQQARFQFMIASGGGASGMGFGVSTPMGFNTVLFSARPRSDEGSYSGDGYSSSPYMDKEYYPGESSAVLAIEQKQKKNKNVSAKKKPTEKSREPSLVALPEANFQSERTDAKTLHPFDMKGHKTHRAEQTESMQERSHSTDKYRTSTVSSHGNVNYSDRNLEFRNGSKEAKTEYTHTANQEEPVTSTTSSITTTPPHQRVCEQQQCQSIQAALLVKVGTQYSEEHKTEFPSVLVDKFQGESSKSPRKDEDTFSVSINQTAVEQNQKPTTTSHGNNKPETLDKYSEPDPVQDLDQMTCMPQNSGELPSILSFVDTSVENHPQSPMSSLEEPWPWYSASGYPYTPADTALSSDQPTLSSKDQPNRAKRNKNESVLKKNSSQSQLRDRRNYQTDTVTNEFSELNLTATGIPQAGNMRSENLHAYSSSATKNIPDQREKPQNTMPVKSKPIVPGKPKRMQPFPGGAICQTCKKCHSHYYQCDDCGKMHLVDSGPKSRSEFYKSPGYHGNESELKWMMEDSDWYGEIGGETDREGKQKNKNAKGQSAGQSQNRGSKTLEEELGSLETWAQEDIQTNKREPHTAMVKQLDEKTGNKFYAMVSNMKELVAKEGLVVKDVYPDGNCLFAAVVDQLRVRSEFYYTAQTLRAEAVEYLRQNPKQADGTLLSEFLTEGTWEEYLTRMETEGVWGDHMILGAIAEVLGRKIVILGGMSGLSRTVLEPSSVNKDKPEEGEESDSSTASEDCLFLGHMAESHYVSLRRKDWEERLHQILRTKKHSSFLKPGDIRIAEVKPDAEQEEGADMNCEANSDITFSTSDKVLKHLDIFLQQIIKAKFLITAPKMNNATHHSLCIVTVLGPFVDQLDCCLMRCLFKSGYCSLLAEEKDGFSDGNFCVLFFNTPKDTIVFPAPYVQCGPVDLHLDGKDCAVGYTRLVPVHKNTWKGFTIEDNGQYYLTHIPFNKYIHDLPRDAVKWDVKQCIAFRYAWPEEAKEWTQRDRPHGFPNKKSVEKIISGGCHIIPESHPKSRHAESEWKISFALAQMHISKSGMGVSRRNTFHIFKLLVDHQLTTNRTVMGKIDIYHLLDVFYYTCEEVPLSDWICRKSVCVLKMIDRLMECLSGHFLPSYFIKKQNTIQYFTSGDIAWQLDRLRLLRNHMEVSLFFLLDGNGLLYPNFSLGSSVDKILQDMQKYSGHRDIQKSAMECFIPVYTRYIQDLVRDGQYTQAMTSCERSFRDVTGYLKRSTEVFAFKDFLETIVHELPLVNSWMFAFTLDHHLGTELVQYICQGQRVIPIQEVFGLDLLNHIQSHKQLVNIPNKLLTPALICTLLSEMANLLYYDFDEEEASVLATHFFLKQYTQMVLLGSDESGPSGDTSRLARAGYLYKYFVYVYDYYARMKEIVCFVDLLEELEKVCDFCSCVENYKFLGRLWDWFEDEDKADEAYRKAASLQQDMNLNNTYL